MGVAAADSRASSRALPLCRLGDDILSGKDGAVGGAAADVPMADAKDAPAPPAAAATAAVDEDAELQKALAMSMEEDGKEEERCGVGLPAEFRGIYEIYALVTHKGRSASSGHYMGWVKADDGKTWTCFDDDGANECDEEYVLANLKGGGDAHMAYMVIPTSRDSQNSLAAWPRNVCAENAPSA